MKNLKILQTEKLNLETKQLEIIGEVIYKGKILQLYKAEVVNGRIKIL